MTALQLGKRDARPGAVGIRFADVVNTSALATPPTSFGHDYLVGNDWSVLGNAPDPAYPDIQPAGDCAIADALHQHLLWGREVGTSYPMTTPAALQAYSAVTGYDPTQTDADGNNPTDQGTDVPTLIHYRFAKGLVDAGGNTHKIGAAVSLEPGNWEQLVYALFYFDGVTLGVQMAQQWMDAFGNGDFVWDALKSPDVEGGHAITGVAFHDSLARIITWGTDEVGITEDGYAQASDETYAVLSNERLRNGVDVNGFDKQKLIDSLPKLHAILGTDGKPLGPVKDAA